MERVAVVAPVELLSDVLAEVGAAGVVQLDDVREQAATEEVAATVSSRERVAAAVGWLPAAAAPALGERLAGIGGGVVRLPAPRGVDPPTLVDGRGATGAFQPLVDTYATVPYADLNPAALAGVVYVVMFGMMFGDTGHGLLLLLAGAMLLSGRPRALRKARRLAPFVLGAGAASTLFGLAFGEAFGPTRLVPTLWMAPLDNATTLLAVAVAVGGVLLAAAYVVGTLNRLRESGVPGALVATSGIAGASLYAGLAVAGLGWYRHVGVLTVGGAGIAAAGFALGYAGLYFHEGGRMSGALRAGIEMYGTVARIGTNTVSFARLAAFGLTHAALSGMVWSATTGLWHHGPSARAAAVAVLVVGNAVAFALEGLVAGVQALRLEYYELFSRVFVGEGRKFQPWHLAPVPGKENTCSPG